MHLAAASTPTACDGAPHTELWGAVVHPGNENLQASAADCCTSCRAYEPTLDVLSGGQCNTWVYNPTTRHCWLKHQKEAELTKAAATVAARQRAGGTGTSPWHSGVWLEHKACADCVAPAVYNGCIGKDRCNTSRACGSPAIDGYSHVDPRCFESSPTARLYQRLVAAKAVLHAVSEQHADYDGLGVRWGIGHKKQTWRECEQACRDHTPAASGGPFARLPCNVWTWCSRTKCFEPDAHKHSFGDCWLKFTENPEAPEVNMRTPGMRAAFMKRHRADMVDGVSWVSGALLAPGVRFTNGTWGPRAYW